MTTERHDFWVCTDCYFAHHYGATKIEREATEAEEARYLCGHDDRSLMGLEFAETDAGLQVTEWFAGESDQRCEGGEPLRLVPEDAAVYDWTCSNHFYGQDVTPDNWADDCETCDGTRVVILHDDTDGQGRYQPETDECPDCIPEPTCDQCGGTGWEDGMIEFTWSSCDGCGCHLGGSRHRLAVDIDHQEAIA